MVTSMVVARVVVKRVVAVAFIVVKSSRHSFYAEDFATQKRRRRFRERETTL